MSDRIKRIRDLKSGQAVWVEYADPETSDTIKMLLMVERVEQATKLWERGDMRPGEWVVDLKPGVHTEFEDHLVDGGKLGGVDVKILPMTSLTEMFGMEIREKFSEDEEETAHRLASHLHEMRRKGEFAEARRTEEHLTALNAKLEAMEEVELCFSWGPGVETTVTLELVDLMEKGEL